MPARNRLLRTRWLFGVAAIFTAYVVILTLWAKHWAATAPVAVEAAFGITYLCVGIALEYFLRRIPRFVSAVILISAIALALFLFQNLMHGDVPHSVASIVGLLVCLYLFVVTRRLAKDFRV